MAKLKLKSMIATLLIGGVLFTGCGAKKPATTAANDTSTNTSAKPLSIIEQQQKEAKDILSKVDYNDPKSVATAFMHLSHTNSPGFLPFDEDIALSNTDRAKALEHDRDKNLEIIKEWKKLSKFISVNFDSESKDKFISFGKYFDGITYNLTVKDDTDGKGFSYHEVIELTQEDGKWRVVNLYDLDKVPKEKLYIDKLLMEEEETRKKTSSGEKVVLTEEYKKTHPWEIIRQYIFDQNRKGTKPRAFNQYSSNYSPTGLVYVLQYLEYDSSGKPTKPTEKHKIALDLQPDKSWKVSSDEVVK